MPSAFSRFKNGLAHGNDLLNLRVVFYFRKKGRKFLSVKNTKKKRILILRGEKMMCFIIKDQL